MASSRDRVAAALHPIVESLGLDLEDVTLRTAGKRGSVRVVLDADGGLSLDQVAQASRAISEVLDEQPLFGDLPYTLEVTTPGVERPLKLPRHWRRAAGRLVQATLTDGSKILGRVMGNDDESVQLDIAGEVRPLLLAEVVKAVVQVEFARPGEEHLLDEDAEGIEEFVYDENDDDGEER